MAQRDGRTGPSRSVLAVNPWRRLDLIADLEQLRRDVWTTPG